MQRALTAFIVLLFFCSPSYTQNKKVDSLYALLKTDNEDTIKVIHLNQLAFELRNTNPPTAIEISDKAMSLGRKLNYGKGEAEAIIWKGMAEVNRGNTDSAKILFIRARNLAQKARSPELEARSYFYSGLLNSRLGEFNEGIKNLDEALKIPESLIKDKKLIGSIHNIYGNCMSGKSNYKEAIDHLLKALKIATQLDDKQGMAAALNNLGNNYQKLQMWQDALDQFERALKINTETGNKSWLANNYVNMGIIYVDLAWNPKFRKQLREQNKSAGYYTDLALKNYSVAMEIKKEVGDQNSVAHILNNIAVVEMRQAGIKKSSGDKKGFEELENKVLAEFDEIVKIRQQTGDKDGMAKAYMNMGQAHFQLKHYSRATAYYQKALGLAHENGSKEQIRNIYMYQSVVDSALNDFRAAYANYRLFSRYNDSITNEEDSKKALQMRLNYDFDVKRTADSLKNAEQANHERLKHEQELKHQRVYTYGGLIGFALMLVVAIVAIKAYRQKQNANAIISMQKQIVEVKQKAILDSIYYAQRIQNSLLPTDKYIERKMESLKKNKSFKAS